MNIRLVYKVEWSTFCEDKHWGVKICKPNVLHNVETALSRHVDREIDVSTTYQLRVLIGARRVFHYSAFTFFSKRLFGHYSFDGYLSFRVKPSMRPFCSCSTLESFCNRHHIKYILSRNLEGISALLRVIEYKDFQHRSPSTILTRDDFSELDLYWML